MQTTRESHTRSARLARGTLGLLDLLHLSLRLPHIEGRGLLDLVEIYPYPRPIPKNEHPSTFWLKYVLGLGLAKTMVMSPRALA